MKTDDLAKTALIAGLYVVLTVAFAPISYGVVQMRVAEALTVLPFIYRYAGRGLFAGCLIANIYSGLGIYDVIFGSLATLVAAQLTAKMTRPALAPLPPVLVNAAVVGAQWSIAAKMPLYLTISYVGVGQLGACYLIGYPLLRYLLKRRDSGL